MAPFRGNKATVGINYVSPTKVGRLVGVDTTVQAQTYCAGGITHTSPVLKSLTQARWTAPPAGTGTVTFLSVVVQDYKCVA